MAARNVASVRRRTPIAVVATIFVGIAGLLGMHGIAAAGTASCGIAVDHPIAHTSSSRASATAPPASAGNPVVSMPDASMAMSHHTCAATPHDRQRVPSPSSTTTHAAAAASRATQRPPNAATAARPPPWEQTRSGLSVLLT